MATDKGKLTLGKGAGYSTNPEGRIKKNRTVSSLGSFNEVPPKAARVRRAYLPKGQSTKYVTTGATTTRKATHYFDKGHKDYQKMVTSTPTKYSSTPYGKKQNFNTAFQSTLLDTILSDEDNPFQYEKSVIETAQEYTTPEQVLAGFINQAGPNVAQAFIQSAKEAITNPDITSVSAASFHSSTNPAEKLAYMSKYAIGGTLDLSKVATEVSAGHRREHPGLAQTSYDLISRKFDRADQDYHELVKSKTPMEKMLDVMGARTRSMQSSKQDVLSPDKLDVSMAHPQKFNLHAETTMKAFRGLASLYLPKEIEGDARAQAKDRIVTGLAKMMPRKLADYATVASGLKIGEVPDPWSVTLPSMGEMYPHVEKSTRNILTNPMVSKETRPLVNQYIKEVKNTTSFRNERGLESTFNPLYKEPKYIADELAAAGMDPSNMVLSQEAARDQLYEFRTTRNPVEALNAGLGILGLNAVDLQDPMNAIRVRTVLRDGLDSDKTFRASVQATINPGADLNTAIDKRIGVLKHQGTSVLAAMGQESIAQSAAINAAMGGELTKKNEARATAIKHGLQKARDGRNSNMKVVKDETTLQLEAEALYAASLSAPLMEPSNFSDGNTQPGLRDGWKVFQKGISNQTPQQAQTEWLKKNPHLRLMGGDGKRSDGTMDEEVNAAWMKERAARAPSSMLAKMHGEAPSDTSGPASAILKANLGIDSSGNIDNAFTRSGDKLEDVALNYYRKNYESSAFDVGLITNRLYPGQSSTPDAMVSSANKIVEVKSRQGRVIDTKNATGSDMKELQKNYMQMQHQMMMTGASSGDLVQIARGANTNLPASLTPEGVASDFDVRNYERDDELINRMKPVWSAVAGNASKISNLNEGDKKILAEAVAKGNVESFEILAEKHGLDTATTGYSLGKGGGGRKGGGGGPKDKGWYDYIASNKGGMSASQLTHSKLAMGGKFARGLNVAATVASAAVDVGKSMNDSFLTKAYGASSSGMSDSLYLEERSELRSAFNMSDERATSNLQTLAEASGGMRMGQMGGMVNIVQGSLGLLSADDVYGYRGKKGEATALMQKMRKAGENRGYDEMEWAAIAKKTGLTAALATEKGSSSAEKGINTAAAVTQQVALELMAGGVQKTADAATSIYEFITSDPKARTPGVEGGARSMPDYMLTTKSGGLPTFNADDLKEDKRKSTKTALPFYPAHGFGGYAAALQEVKVTVEAKGDLAAIVEDAKNKNPAAVGTDH